MFILNAAQKKRGRSREYDSYCQTSVGVRASVNPSQNRKVKKKYRSMRRPNVS